MPYASGPSVRRLSKIATLLLARNYIVMLQRNVDELRRLLAHHAAGDTSTGSPPPVTYHQAVSPYDDRPQSPPAPHRASTPQNLDVAQTRDLAGGRLLPPAAPPPAEVILAMTSLPAGATSDGLRSQLSARAQERWSMAADWSVTSMGWQRELVERRLAGRPLTTAADSATVRPRLCHPTDSVSAGGRLTLIPWIDCLSRVPLMAARLPASHFI